MSRHLEVAIFVWYTTVLLVSAKPKQNVVKSYSELHKCELSEELKTEIASYDSVVNDIIDFAVSGPFKGRAYSELERFIDTFGPRPSGSEVLERAIDHVINITRAEDVRDVYTEEVQVPHWVRGHESAELLEPRRKPLSLLGLGTSVATAPDGVTAEAVVVTSFDELDAMDNDKVKGKIVVYDQPYVSYGDTVRYRSQGASKAAAKGAVAVLIRTIAPFSIYSPHTGMQRYSDNVTKIPAACITLEDADFLGRLYKNKEKIVIKLVMSSTMDTKTSRNTLIDVKGTQHPEKLVIVSGHIDSWDVGTGAMDDGGGMIVSWAVPIILKELNLRPKRTIRSIFWTGEELGLVGAFAYAKKHKLENDNINFVMESDEGTFKPLGLTVGGSQHARCIVAEVLKLFSSINATALVEEDAPGSDIVALVSQGVPGAGLLNANEKYFWFHHSEGDTMNVENAEELDLCAAFWTAVAYVIADMSVDIPRK
ncbi:hypothetical protein JYU34_005577 [Plutella xylostella]|uniref:Carboxypeptidase Q n=1 Tax=Plutella xylostella TaxID=51655 RepID=A0ABQ7QTK0_PLUXY|nr:hypothetical protein JYU34_005577 [Plutella xylostella]